MVHRGRSQLMRTPGPRLPDISAAVKMGSAREAAWEQLNTPGFSIAFTSATKCRNKLGEKSSSNKEHFEGLGATKMNTDSRRRMNWCHEGQRSRLGAGFLQSRHDGVHADGFRDVVVHAG
jgi:hypothetical protein